MGNLFALIQKNVKLLISYICVADVGYNLVAITSYTSLGLQGNLYFFIIGGITTALSFMAVGIFNHYGLRTLEDFSGLGKKMPITSLASNSSAFIRRRSTFRRIYGKIPCLHCGNSIGLHLVSCYRCYSKCASNRILIPTN